MAMDYVKQTSERSNHTGGRAGRVRAGRPRHESAHALLILGVRGVLSRRERFCEVERGASGKEEKVEEEGAN